MLGGITNKITNLSFNLKELYLKKDIDISMIKIPFGCEIKYDYDSILKYYVFNMRSFSVFQDNMMILIPSYPSTKDIAMYNCAKYYQLYLKFYKKRYESMLRYNQSNFGISEEYENRYFFIYDTYNVCKLSRKYNHFKNFIEKNFQQKYYY